MDKRGGRVEDLFCKLEDLRRIVLGFLDYALTDEVVCSRQSGRQSGAAQPCCSRTDIEAMRSRWIGSGNDCGRVPPAVLRKLADRDQARSTVAIRQDRIPVRLDWYHRGLSSQKKLGAKHNGFFLTSPVLRFRSA